MRFRAHLLSSAATGLLLYPRRPLRAAALIGAGTLLDLDHLLLYGLYTGDWSVSGALRYDRYRHRRLRVGDTRPRYGPLRSWLHSPLLLLPLWRLARGQAWLRPLAIGLSLHLLLDYLRWPAHQLALWGAGGRCVACGATRRTKAHSHRRGGRRGMIVLCRRCWVAWSREPDRGGADLTAVVH